MLLDLTLDVNKKFSTRYYLNLVLIDEENRRYFKQQEITMFRRKSKHLMPYSRKLLTILFFLLITQLMMAILQMMNRIGGSTCGNAIICWQANTL